MNGQGDIATTKYRDANIDILRAFAIIVVVFGHSLFVSLGENQDNSVLRLIQTFQMPLLFTISGYSLGFSFPIISHYRNFITKKITRLCVPYLLWATIHYLINGQIYNYSFNLKDYANEILHSDFWFLRELFIYMFIVVGLSMCISIFTKNRYVILMLTSLLMGVAFVILKLEIYVFSFIWGLILYEIMHSGIWNAIIGNRIVRWIMLATLSVVMIYYSTMIICGRQKFASAFIITTSVFVVFCLLPLKTNSKYMDYFAGIGKNTLGIYAIHWCLLFSVMACLNIPNILTKFAPFWISVIALSVVWLVICDVLIRIISLNGVLGMVLLGKKNKR